MAGLTLYDKLWQAHLLEEYDDGIGLLYIDRHYIHEVTSPQAFDGLRMAGRDVFDPGSVVATPDHNVPTARGERLRGIETIRDPMSKQQVLRLEKNSRDFSIPMYSMDHPNQGIVHVMGPELGYTQPGMTVVCGDSHTSTHGAFAALAHGIGTSEVEHVLATQCLKQKKMRNMRVVLDGELPSGIFAKDLVLYLIGRIGTAGGTGFAIEFSGSCVQNLSMEGRMTLCNMAIEAGARAGLVAVDEVTLEYMRKTPHGPKGELRERAETYWRTLVSDPDARFDEEIRIQVDSISPQVSWGTSPEQVVGIEGNVPKLSDAPNREVAETWRRSLEYMGLQEGLPVTEIPLQRVFIGSCTNGRIEDLREAAAMVRGKTVHPSIREVLVVPGSGRVKQMAEMEGLDRIFTEAGFLWREPGCSMCLAMNSDRLGEGEHCASTSNRNFEGRQGYGGRTHLVSPAMAAAAAIAGRFVDIRRWEGLREEYR